VKQKIKQRVAQVQEQKLQKQVRQDQRVADILRKIQTAGMLNTNISNNYDLFSLHCTIK
jgi:hypothetical protein